nr:hypothetical protein [Ferrimicrobium acidiphilum]
MIEYLELKDYGQAMKYAQTIKEILTDADKNFKIQWKNGNETGLLGAVFPWIEWHFAPNPVFEYVIKILVDKRVIDEKKVQWILCQLKEALPATYRTMSGGDLDKMVEEINEGA